MSIGLGPNRYGKSGVRLATVVRHPDRHEFTDLTVDIRLEGDFAAAHRDGDNANVLPTDSMRAAVYVLARQQPVDEVERFGLRLARHFLDVSAPTRRAVVSLEAQPWERIPVGGRGHAHAFTRAGGGRRSATVSLGRDADEAEVVAGVVDLYVLKTTGSAFAGFLTDAYTTLAETDDRILATCVAAHWRYATPGVDYDACAGSVTRILLETFAEHDSQSLQHTMYAMGQAVLAAHEEIADIAFTLPNQHHIRVDLSPYGLDNDDEVFVVTDRPFGVIEGSVTRDGTAGQ